MDFRNSYSNRGERFKNISLTWRLGVSNIDLVKIRIANWAPRHDRSGQAVYYYDCKTDEEVKAAVKDVATKPLGEVRELFTVLFDEFRIEKGLAHNTGETQEFLKNTFLPQARALKIKINT